MSSTFSSAPQGFIFPEQNPEKKISTLLISEVYFQVWIYTQHLMEFKQFPLVTQAGFMLGFQLFPFLLCKGKVFCHSLQNSVRSVVNWSLTSFLENLFQCSTMLDILHTAMAFQSFTVGHICLDHHSCHLTQFFLWLPSFLEYNTPSGYNAPMKA